MAKVAAMDAPDVVPPELQAELEEANLQYGMVTGQPLYGEGEIPVAGEPLIPALIDFAFSSTARGDSNLPHAADLAERYGFDRESFLDLFEFTELSTRKSSPWLLEQIEKVGQVVEANPALLFALPFAVAALAGAFAAAGAAGAALPEVAATVVPAGTSVTAATTVAASTTAAGATAAASTAAAATGTAAAGTAAAGTAATAGAATGIATKAAGALAAIKSAAIDKAKEYGPKVVKAINAARTIDAIADGEVPPPPLSIAGDNFLQWGTSLGMSVLEGELAKNAQQMSAEQAALAEAEMRRQVEAYQRQMLAGGQVQYRDPRELGVSDPAYDAIVAATERQNRNLLLIGGGLGLGFLALIAFTRPAAPAIQKVNV